jgi:hypothetical protein
MKTVRSALSLIGILLLAAANAHAGRWLSPDPIEQMERDPRDPDSPNLYGYVRNDPVGKVDPWGLWDYNVEPDTPPGSAPPIKATLAAAALGLAPVLAVPLGGAALTTMLLHPVEAVVVTEGTIYAAANYPGPSTLPHPSMPGAPLALTETTITQEGQAAVQEAKALAQGAKAVQQCTSAATKGAAVDSQFVIQFGKDPNQIQHAFRHVDALGLNRAQVQTAVRDHLQSVAMQVVVGKPFNQIIEVAGRRIQYTAFRLPDGTINVGRIHGVP